MPSVYEDTYRRAQDNPLEFWAAAAEPLYWHRRWDTVRDDGNPPFYRWFSGGRLNTCYNCLDRHIERGRGKQLALVYDSPVTDTVRRFTFNELRDAVARVAGALAAQGVEAGDRVVIYMPMVPEAVIGMLACARIGAVHSVVFGGFAPKELAARIDDAQPRLILSASCGIEVDRVVPYKPLLDAAIELSSHKPERTIILQRPQAEAPLVEGRDLDWRTACDGAEPADCVPVAATDPLYILYTSGTTGVPKGVVRDNGGHAVALHWSMEHVYGVGAGEVYWAASDIGWVVGHSYIVYGPLLRGATTILYEGKPVGTPDPGAFWRVIEDHGVNVLFTAPTAFRAIKKEDPDGAFMRNHDLSRFRTLFLAGERIRSGHPAMGARPPRRAGHRPLVADGDLVGHRRQLRRPRHAAGEAGLADPGRAGLRRAGAWRGRERDAGRPDRRPRRQNCRCRPAACRRSGTTTTATGSRTCRATRATT